MTRCAPVLLALLLAGLDCGGHVTSSSDMAGDMSHKVDLGPPVLTGLPACGADMGVVGAAALWTSVVKPKCSTATECHGTDVNFVYYSLGSAADMVSQWVNKPSSEVRMDRITPKMPNQSYVLFRLLGEGGAVDPPNGVSSIMPSGASSRLSDAELCMFLAWVNSGAPM